jgi:hypothetical protein
MAERTKAQANDRFNIPNSPACGQWETLLVDALDGLLRPEDEAVFSNHMATCSACTAMFEQARRGREWLEFLAPEPAVPAYLLDRILVETGHGKIDTSTLVVAGGVDEGGNVLAMPAVWQRPGFMARMRRFAEPRLLMTAAMAFFSIALTLSMTGVRFTRMSLADLRPTVVRSQLEKRIMTASTPIIRYYDHLRFVYEVESRVKEMRRTTENEQKSQPKSTPADSNGETHKKDGTQTEPNRLNPNNAPQQSVNPPDLLWSDETLEARLEMRKRLQPQTGIIANRTEKGFPTLTEASGFLAKRVSAMPDRSSTCVA